MLEVKILCQCIFNDLMMVVPLWKSTRVYTCLVGQYSGISSLISGRMVLCSVGVMLFHKSRWWTNPERAMGYTSGNSSLIAVGVPWFF